jgi:glycosyltransferase involved in cell wall biosynthesis
MNVLALMPDAYRGFGGIAQYNRDLIDALAGSDRVDRIVSLTRHFPETDSGLEPPPAKLAQHFLPGHTSRYVMAALRHLLSLHPDVILCGHINLLPVAALLKKLTGRPLILEAYGIEAWERLPGLRSWGTECVDLVIAISRYTRERLISWSGIESHRIRVVPNAVHLNRYSSAEKPRYLVERYGVEGKRVLLTVGRLPGHERYKGQDRIITLLSKLITRVPNLVYLIVGDGSDRARLETMVSTFLLQEHVIFAGRIREEEKIDHYHLADAFAMPSTSEGFGFVFLEAAACGLPVLGGRGDGSRDALLDGRLGVMVDPESPDELLDGLEAILQKEKHVPDCIKPFDFPRFKMQVEELVGGIRGQKSEVRGQRSEVRGQKSEVRGQKSENR